MAEYRRSKGKLPAVIRGISSAECPVSLITPASMSMLELVNRARRIADSIGVNPLGNDGSKLPAKLLDAVDLITMESFRVDEAMMQDEGGVRDEIEEYD